MKKKKLKAVALKYVNTLPAPFIVAKGEGELGRKILETAAKYNISVVEEKFTADSLFEIPVGDFIPEHFFEIVASILAGILPMRELYEKNQD